MNTIKFCGKDKRDSVRKAIAFFYDNLNEEMRLDIFLAKCRVQGDGKTIHFYQTLEVDMKKLAELRYKRREERKRNR